MKNRLTSFDRPIRVSVFSTDLRALDRREFVSRLAEHPEIDLVGIYCQSKGESFLVRAKELWHRRGLLAIPILIVELRDFLRSPHGRELNDKLSAILAQVRFVENIHAPVVLDEIAGLNVDLGLIYGSPMLRPELFEIPDLGTLGIHHGILPDYRGVKSTFWAIFNGESHAGVTIQRVKAGIDTGDILQQGSVLIGRKSRRSIERAIETIGVDLYIQAIVDTKHGSIDRCVQHRKGTLYRHPTITDLAKFYLQEIRRRFV